MDPHDGTALQKAPERTEAWRHDVLSASAFFKMKDAIDTQCAISLEPLEELEIRMYFSHWIRQHPLAQKLKPKMYQIILQYY